MDWLRRFWAHPLVQIGAWLVGILLGALLVYYVAIVAEKTRELTYYVHPVRARIVQAGQASSLRVYHAGEELTTDVTAVQVQVWNQGREAIEESAMLEPLVISTADGTRILEAAIRQQTRPEIVRLHLDTAQQERGRLGVSWELLEEQDGGIIQLILAGSPQMKVSAAAALKGQRQIREATMISVRGRTEALLWVLGYGVVLGVLPLIQLFRWKRQAEQKKARLERHLNPVPEDVLDIVSLWYASGWRRWSGLVLPGVVAVGALVLTGYLLWVLRAGFVPTPPLAF